MKDNVPHRTARIIELLQEKVRLEPFHRRLFYIVFAILWLSGALWLGIQWLKDPSLGPVRTPVQALAMRVHGAILLVYLPMLGTLITHVRRGAALKANRWSGFTVIGLNGVLLLSGWMLYYVADDTVRDWSSAIHWGLGCLMLVLIIAHVLLGRSWAVRLLGRGRPDNGNGAPAARRA